MEQIIFTHMSEAPHDRLRKAREAAGFASPKAASTFHGWSEHTYKSHENGIRGLKGEVARKYAEAFKVSPGWLLTGEGIGPDGVAGQSSDPKPVIFKEVGPIVGVRVVGSVAANSWMNVEDMNFDYDDIELLPSIGGYPPAWQFGLRVVGHCLNKIAREGDDLVCLSIAASHVTVQDGDLVIVERRRFSGQMVERTAKRIRKTVKGFELWPESDHKDHQEPITLYDPPFGEEIQVIGKVLFIVRRP